MIYEPLFNLDLESRDDVAEALKHLLAPLESRLSPGKARLPLGDTAANSEPISHDLEGLSRSLWGVAPLLKGGYRHPYAELVPTMLTNGTNPAHPEYWGRVTEPCIRSVEMPAIAYALALAPKDTWGKLSGESQQHVQTWLSQINTSELWPNNWLFFRVLVNLAFKRLGLPVCHDRIDDDFAKLDSFYLADGWYRDGDGSRSDYYIAFAMHFYSLVYAGLGGIDDPQRQATYRDRATAFAQDYLHWFSAEGASFPFGRSLTYRFAFASFWGALAFANGEALPWGVIKGLYLRHLSHWFKQPCYDKDGLLTLGYGYPNLNIIEGYSSPGSPYWAFKSFLPLALPDSHPFWAADVAPLPDLPAVTTQAHPKMIITRDHSADHVVALAGGQLEPQTAGHMRAGLAKYEKFAYSSAFGFSVPLGADNVTQLACDSTIAFSDDGVYYRPRRYCLEANTSDDIHQSRYQPLPSVTVNTWLIPAVPWHIRIHRVEATSEVSFVEGGYSLATTEDAQLIRVNTVEQNNSVHYINEHGITGIQAFTPQYSETELIEPIANSNLMAPRTVLPQLRGTLTPGTYTLACAVLGRPGKNAHGIHTKAWQTAPILTFIGDEVTITQGNCTTEQLTFTLAKF